MRITFLLPNYSHLPVGGFKVVYEYANRLQDRGHRVTVVHPRSVERQKGAAWLLKNWFWWPNQVRRRDGTLVPWFPMHRDVKLRMVPDLRSAFVPRGDAIIATAYQTAEWLNTYSPAHGRKYYLIQHYETWAGSNARVNATWRMPLRKLVIARWLVDVACELGVVDDVDYVPNGLDLGRFRIFRPIDSRPRRIGMLHHSYPWKGTAIGQAALERVRQAAPDVDVVYFGVMPRPDDVPEWVTYICNPHPEQLAELYNSCAIFLSASWTEGWGLPPAEAMACGCAVVSADNGGIRDYAIHDRTALLAPPKDPQALAESIMRLLNDDSLRRTLAHAGHEQVQVFTWDAAVTRLENALNLHYQPNALDNSLDVGEFVAGHK
jgi:glycosyltransferase involved in cell wall biosynthesis